MFSCPGTCCGIATTRPVRVFVAAKFCRLCRCPCVAQLRRRLQAPKRGKRSCRAKSVRWPRLGARGNRAVGKTLWPEELPEPKNLWVLGCLDCSSMATAIGTTDWLLILVVTLMVTHLVAQQFLILTLVWAPPCLSCLCAHGMMSMQAGGPRPLNFVSQHSPITAYSLSFYHYLVLILQHFVASWNYLPAHSVNFQGCSSMILDKMNNLATSTRIPLEMVPHFSLRILEYTRVPSRNFWMEITKDLPRIFMDCPYKDAYIYIHVYLYIYMYIYICICICTCTCIYIYINPINHFF